MINQNARRRLSHRLRRPETLRPKIGLNRKTRCQQCRELGGGCRRQSRRAERGNLDGYGSEFAGLVPFRALAKNALGAVSSWRLRQMAVNHGAVVVLRSGMKVKRRQAEEE
jgi:hypothetical protein